MSLRAHTMETSGRWLILVVTALLVVVPLLPALAQAEGLVVTVRGSSFDLDGGSTITVNVTGEDRPEDLAAGAFAVVENGDDVGPVTVEPLLDSEPEGLFVLLAIDISTSMAGEPLEDLKQAAIETVETLTAQGIPVGVMTFDTIIELLSEPTTDAAALTALIDPLEARGGTALHDAVIEGADILADLDGVRTLVLLADGEDTVSDASLEEAIVAVQAREVAVTVVGLETELFEADVLLPLAEDTGGGFFTTADSAGLSEVFAEVAADVASQYQLTYRSAAFEEGELDIAVAVTHEGSTASASFVVLNPREAEEVREARAVEAFDPGMFGSRNVLLGALVIGFLALAAFLIVLLVPRGDRAASRTLRRGVTMVQRGDAQASAVPGMAASSIGQAAIDLVDRAPKPEGYDERLQTSIDRAGWPLRSGEFTALRIAAAALLGLLLWALTGVWWFAIIGVVLGVLVPRVMLDIARTRRQNRFMEQLPDTLQLLAGTLKAGYGVLQAIDTVVKEVEDPMAEEFQRALTEARLGLPLDESLEAMAERVDSDDFRWVVVAMNIQRQVGGNLAELLETVAATLRGREQLRRQIQVLSAEGRLSAWILIALPFVIVGAIVVTNPGYLAPLFADLLGIIMVIAAVIFMGIGIVIIRKMIDIEV